jgi:signal transduction histidine kinase
VRTLTAQPGGRLKSRSWRRVAGAGLLMLPLSGCSAVADGGAGPQWWVLAVALVAAVVATLLLVRQITARPFRQAAARGEQERSALVAERAVLLTEREELLRERENRESRLRAVTSERDVLSSEQQRLSGEVESLAQQRDELTAERDELQGSVDATFVNLAMRTLTLVERQLVLIETLEGREADPGQLDNLFRLDHLATRMRRNSENMLLLAGLENSRRSRETVPLLDVVRAAVSEIERYERVKLGFLPRVRLLGGAADDCSHLIAELMENATAFSPPQDQVDVGAWRLDNGEVMLSVTDRGIGMPPERMREINEQLSATEEPGDLRQGEWFGKALTGRSMGLFVVARLARRHGIRVQLRENAQGGGVTAMVVVPREVLVDEAVSVAEMDEQRRAERAAATAPRPESSAEPSWAGGTLPAARPAPEQLAPMGEDGLPPLPRRSPGGGQDGGAVGEHARSGGDPGAARHARRPDPEPSAGAPAAAVPLPAEETLESDLPALPRRTPRSSGLPGTGEAPLSDLRRVATDGPSATPGSRTGTPGRAAGRPAAGPGTTPAQLRERLGGFQSGLRRAARQQATAEGQSSGSWPENAPEEVAIARTSAIVGVSGTQSRQSGDSGHNTVGGSGGEVPGRTGTAGGEAGEVQRAVGAPGEEDNG